MATISFKGGEEYILKLSRLEKEAVEKVVGPAIHDGAKIVADAIRTELQAVPTDEGWGTQEQPVRGPKKTQKAALLGVLGITTMQKDSEGVYNVKIGFDGYNNIRSKRWHQMDEQKPLCCQGGEQKKKTGTYRNEKAGGGRN